MDGTWLNEWVQWVFGAILVVAILGLFGWLKFKRDEKLVADVLKAPAAEAGQNTKTTTEICSITNLHEKRVRKVCQRSRRIRKHEDGSWRLHD